MPSKEVTAARKAEGLCATCGAREPSGYFGITCQPCRDKSKARTKQRRTAAHTKGVCEACMRRKRSKGRTRCKSCITKYGHSNTGKVE